MPRENAMFFGASAGAMLLAGIASILATCCGTTGSWAVNTLGVPGAVALARLRFIQPYETIGALALLIAVFWIAYRPARFGADPPSEPRSLHRAAAWTTLIVTSALLATAHTQLLSGEVAPDDIAIG